MLQIRLKQDHYGYLFIAPFFITFAIFGLYPVFNTFYLSLTDTTLLSDEVHFVGLKNFTILFSDRAFSSAVRNTWILWIFNFLPQIGIAMLLSVWFNSLRLRIKWVGFWRAIFLLPNLLMPASIAALFFSLFSYYGPVNQFLVRLGLLPEAMQFLQSPTVARGIVIFIQWWMWFGATVILLMAGMTSIPESLYESAMMDGATEGQMFRYITLPLLKPVLVYLFVTSLVGGMQMFDIPYLLTDGRGSPAGSTMTHNILMYLKFSSSKGNIGAASAVGVMVFVMTCICAVAIFYFLREKD